MLVAILPAQPSIAADQSLLYEGLLCLVSTPSFVTPRKSWQLCCLPSISTQIRHFVQLEQMRLPRGCISGLTNRAIHPASALCHPLPNSTLSTLCAPRAACLSSGARRCPVLPPFRSNLQKREASPHCGPPDRPHKGHFEILTCRMRAQHRLLRRHDSKVKTGEGSTQ